MKKRSKLRPASQTAFSSVTSGTIRRIAIDAICTQFTISTCVIYKNLMENHSNMIVCFLIQILIIFGGRCNRYFWDIRLKLYSFINFSMLFQFVLTKFSKSELSSCFSESWSSDQLLQEAIRVSGVFFFTLFILLYSDTFAILSITSKS